MNKIISVLLISAVLLSCSKTSTTEVKCQYTESTTVASAAEIAALQAYCTTNVPGAIQHSSGLFGTTFQLGNLIVGWQKGIPLIKPNGTIRLFIPPSLGYGVSGSGTSVPPNAYLIFDIQLTGVQ